MEHSHSVPLHRLRPTRRRLASFWAEALGWRQTHAEDDEVVLEPPAGSREDGVAPDLLFLRVPEAKAGKNRLHIDLRPKDQAAEVARLEALGARRVDVGQGTDVDLGGPGRPGRQRVLRAEGTAPRGSWRRAIVTQARTGHGLGTFHCPGCRFGGPARVV